VSIYILLMAAVLDKKEETNCEIEYVDFDNVSKHLICSICLLPYQQPVRSPCGHTFCFGCITGWLARNSSCPEDRTALNKEHFEKPGSIDRLAANLCDELKVHCKYKGGGCEWKGTRGRLQVHLTNECTENEVTCPHKNLACEIKTTRKFMVKHLEECPFEKIKGYCYAQKREVDDLKSQIDQLQNVLLILADKASIPLNVSFAKKVNAETGIHRTLKKYVKIENNGLEVTHLGQPGETIEIMARATFPVPTDSPKFYFEVTILNKGELGAIGIGLVPGKHDLVGMPGWFDDSCGYHGDDGQKFHFEYKGQGKPYGPVYIEGDTVGCGIEIKTGNVFFTKNGKLLGVAFEGFSLKKPLYPCIGMCSGPAKMRFNFSGNGTTPFMYKDYNPPQ